MLPRRRYQATKLLRTLLSQIGLSFLDAGHDHVTATSSGQLVEASTPATDGDDIQVLCASVVSTVHHSSHGQTHGHAELVTAGSTFFLQGASGKGEI